MAVDIGNLDNCPDCGAQWKGDDIYQYFLCQKMFPEAEQHEVYKDKTDEEIYRAAQDYGYTHENPVRFRKVIGVEYPYGHPKRYDGVSLWHCPECKGYWSRWTGKKITPDFSLGQKIPDPDIGPG